jgi:hypothetical protein
MGNLSNHYNRSYLHHLLGSLPCNSCLMSYKIWVRLVNIINDMMKSVNAKRAVRIVQQQSVHFLCFYSIGRFLKVKTFSRYRGLGIVI